MRHYHRFRRIRLDEEEAVGPDLVVHLETLPRGEERSCRGRGLEIVEEVAS